MSPKKVIVILMTVVAVSVTYMLWTGYFISSIDHDEHKVYFIKKMPTFTRHFVNPFANEGDYLAVGEMSPDIRNEFIRYCKYAYGIDDDDKKSLDICRGRAIDDVE